MAAPQRLLETPSPTQPFKLISTDQLRESERQIWSEHFPPEIAAKWIEDDRLKQLEIEDQHAAIHNELKQVKSTHSLYLQSGALFFPSDYSAIKMSTPIPQQQ